MFLQGNRHIRANHAACCFLDSKPSGLQDVDFFSKAHEVAGMANSSLAPNAEFVDVGYDTILEAKMDMRSGTEVFSKYDPKVATPTGRRRLTRIAQPILIARNEIFV